MAKARPTTEARVLESALRRIQEDIGRIRYICTGTVLHKTKRCGSATCACARKPAARHGPYYEWHRREDGRQVHSMLPEDVGPLFVQAAQNYRKLRLLLREWEKESARAIVAKSQLKSFKRKDL